MATVLVHPGKAQAPAADGGGRGEGDKGGGRGRGNGKTAAGVWSHRRKMTALLTATLVSPATLRRVSWILEVLVRRCRARLPAVLGSFSNLLTTFHALLATSVLALGLPGSTTRPCEHVVSPCA